LDGSLVRQSVALGLLRVRASRSAVTVAIVVDHRNRTVVGENDEQPGIELRIIPCDVGPTLLMLTPELAGSADNREGCHYGKAEKGHAGVPSGGGGAGAGYGSADRARG